MRKMENRKKRGRFLLLQTLTTILSLSSKPKLERKETTRNQRQTKKRWSTKDLRK